MNVRAPLLLTAVLACLCPAARAQSALDLGALFGDHMLAARDKPLRVWGGANPGAEVSGMLWFKAGDRSTAYLAESTADEQGAWSLEFPAQPAGGSYELSVTSGEVKKVVRDVCFGDLWICSGQSNMEWPLQSSAEPEAALASAERPLLRLFVMPQRRADAPQRDAPGQWMLCTPQSAASFSGVGYHFGRALSERLGTPLGLIQAAWGGTPAEAWTPMPALLGVEAFEPILTRGGDAQTWPPAVLYNGMIHPLLSCAPRGVIWYQGESNAERAEQYRPLFAELIGAWRAEFEAPELPFLFVQLANFGPRAEQPGASTWAELRESQAAALALPATGMAVAIDVGAADDIHPRDKRSVGERLALEAARVAYGLEWPSRGPRFAELSLDGPRARVRFEHADGLKTRDGAAPAGFALAGADKVFHWATGRLEGDAVVLESPNVQAPVAVRFAWADNPAHNLINAAGLPAEPFRTDSWPGATAGRR